VHLGYFAQATVLITGASAGIGWEFARQLAPAAKTMILVGRRDDRLKLSDRNLRRSIRSWNCASDPWTFVTKVS
jgi:short-subunit dehydrogenase